MNRLKRRQQSLAAKLSRPFLVLIVTALLIVGASLTYISWKTQQQQLVENQRKSATYVAATIRSYLQQTIQELESFAQAAYVERDDRRHQTALLKTLWASRQATFSGLTLLDTHGQELARFATYYTFLPSDLTNQRESALFQRAMSNQVYIAAHTETSPEGQAILRVGLPIREASGAVVGVMAAEVNVKAMVDTVQSEQIGQSGYAYIVDQAGQLIAHKDPSSFLQLRGKDLTYVPIIADIARGSLTQRTEYPGLGSSQVPRGARVLGAQQAVGLIPWYVITELPSSEANAPINAMLATLAALLATTLTFSAGLGYWLPRQLIRPLGVLTQGAQRFGQGDLRQRIDITSHDELEILAQTFNAMATQLQDLIGSLEARIQARTAQLRAGAEVARVASSILEPQELMQQTVHLIQERFGFYYTGIFLLDEEKRWAVLRAGTGEAGRKMLAEGHKLEATMNAQSMVGWVCANKQARIALDVGQEAVRFANPQLPNTRSEIALPLRVGDRVLGALDVQSEKEAAFDENDIAVLQGMADQVAVAIDNARLFAQAQTALKELEASQRRFVVQSWSEYARGRFVSGYKQIGSALAPLDQPLPEAQQAIAARRIECIGGNGDDQIQPSSTLISPVLLSGQPIGAIGLSAKPGQRWTDEDIALVQAIGEQFGLAAENLRLFEETQRHAAREQLASQITSRMRESLEVDTVLKTAADEMYQALGLDEIVVQLAMEDKVES